MKKVFITDYNKEKYKPKELFPLVRPFLVTQTRTWNIKSENFERWNCVNLEIEITPSLADADFVLVSEVMDHKHDNRKYRKLAKINKICVERNILHMSILVVIQEKNTRNLLILSITGWADLKVS